MLDNMSSIGTHWKSKKTT